jgi:hypothetical protein
MEEKLVKVLLDRYKEKGIDMYALLDDQFFMKLELYQKVDLIKQFASEISTGTNRSLTKKDIRALVLDAGVAGLGTGLGAVAAAKSGFHLFHEGKGMLPTKYIVGAAALGAAITAANAYMGGRRRINERTEILKKIDETAKNPTDENALKVLVTRNHQFNPPSTSTFNSTSADKFKGVVQNVPQTLLSQVPSYIATKSLEHNFENNTNYAKGVDEDRLYRAILRSRAKLMENIQSSRESVTKNFLGNQ